MYVLKKNMSSSAHYPYFVDEMEGDRLMSSIDLVMHSAVEASRQRRFLAQLCKQVVTFHDNSTKKLTLVDYLSIPPPRTLQLPSPVSRGEQFHGNSA